MQKKGLLSDEIYIVFIFLISIFIINPPGNFPLNDDWAYFWSVKKFVTENKIEISDWATPSLVIQILIGGLICKIFSLSYTTLRILTLSFSLTGILIFFTLIRKLTKNPLIPTFVLLLNPLYLVLSFTFMTDIYFLTSMLLSLYFFYSGYKKENEKFTILGSFFSSLSILIRQIGIFIPFGIFLFYLLKKKKIKIEILILPLLTFILYQYWFKFIHHENWAHKVYVKKITISYFKNIPVLVLNFFKRLFLIIPLLFSFLFPLTLSIRRKKKLSYPLILLVLFLFFYLCNQYIRRNL